MRTRMSGGVRGVRSNAAPISIIVMRRYGLVVHSRWGYHPFGFKVDVLSSLQAICE